MSRVVLLTGSNDAQAESVLQHTAQLLEQRIGNITSRSDIYRSEAWGFTAERDFLNQALQHESNLSPYEVLSTVLDVEQQVGRNRDAERIERELTGERYASRVVDVDVMFYDDEILRSESLTLPHPLLHEREFALRPLCQIMGDYRHPVLGRTLNDILKDIISRKA